MKLIKQLIPVLVGVLMFFAVLDFQKKHPKPTKKEIEVKQGLSGK